MIPSSSQFLWSTAIGHARPRERFVNVDLIGVDTDDGVRLEAALRRPASNSPAKLGVDLVICHHGVGGNFYRPSVFDAVGDDLLRAGCAVLRANSRGPDMAFPTPSGSLGSAFEIVR
jgi:hypothetical protein